jgi:hypothetical protein
MGITSPVFGLRPFLALLSKTEKVPNPTSITFCLFFKLFIMVLSITARAFAASALVILVLLAIFWINSVFVILSLPQYTKVVSVTILVYTGIDFSNTSIKRNASHDIRGKVTDYLQIRRTRKQGIRDKL